MQPAACLPSIVPSRASRAKISQHRPPPRPRTARVLHTVVACAALRWRACGSTAMRGARGGVSYPRRERVAWHTPSDVACALVRVRLCVCACACALVHVVQGHSWIWRHRADNLCPPLANTTQHKAAAEAALLQLIPNVTMLGSTFSDGQLSILRHNWRYAWCDADASASAMAHQRGSLRAEDIVLTHDFKLYLGDVLSAERGSFELFDVELFLQQYLSSLYWSLTMLMKTPCATLHRAASGSPNAARRGTVAPIRQSTAAPILLRCADPLGAPPSHARSYVGPDTVIEKLVGCMLVLLGAFVFAVIMGTVVGVIKSVESHNAALRGARSRHHRSSHTLHLASQASIRDCWSSACCHPPPSMSRPRALIELHIF